MFRIWQAIKNIFFENIFIKIVSLFCGIILWSHVNTTINDRAEFLVPVEYVNLSPKYQISDGKGVTRIEIIVKGDKRSIKAIDRNLLSAHINMYDSKEGEYVVRISRDDINNIPEDVEIVNIIPDKFTLEVSQVEN